MKVIGSIFLFLSLLLGAMAIQPTTSLPESRERQTVYKEMKPNNVEEVEPVIKGNKTDAINLGLYAHEYRPSQVYYRNHQIPLTPNVMHQYKIADLNHDGKLEYEESIAFIEVWYSMYVYSNNTYALTPSEFYDTVSGDCEDFAIWLADFYNYWGVPAYIATISSDKNNHAVAMVKLSEPYDEYINFYVADGTYVEEGYYTVIDYDIIGGFSDAVKGDWYVYDVKTTKNLYGLRI